MSAPKTAKLLNSLLDSQKTDRARIKQLEGRLAEAATLQATAVSAAVSATEVQFKAQLDRAQQARSAERTALTEIATRKDLQITELAATKDFQIMGLTQELSAARQLLAAADAANVELQASVEALGNRLDKTAQAAADLADERAEVARQRAALNHLLDEVRERMRKKDLESESAILNRKMLGRVAPGVNFK